MDAITIIEAAAGYAKTWASEVVTITTGQGVVFFTVDDESRINAMLAAKAAVGGFLLSIDSGRKFRHTRALKGGKTWRIYAGRTAIGVRCGISVVLTDDEKAASAKGPGFWAKIAA